MRRACLLSLVILASSALADTPKPPATAKEALQAFHDLIGGWKGSGLPEGSRIEKQKGQWTEYHDWQWKFKGEQAWLRVDFRDSKNFTHGELHYLPETGLFRLTVQTPSKQPLDFTGKLEERQLTLERTDDKSKETQRLVWSLLHFNRLVYRYEVKPEGKTLYTRVYQVGATKEGTTFANVPTGPECIVSGGAGTSTVSYKGKTYYVCCSGCRDAFLAEPEKFIKEFEEKQKKK